MIKLKLFFISILLTLLTGCASTSTVLMASFEEDTIAKQFTADPSRVHIYLYRNSSLLSSSKDIPVLLDRQTAGRTAPGTYLYWTVNPGKHEIISLTPSVSKITIDTKLGRNYYIWQEVSMDYILGKSKLHEVSEEEGIKRVKECKLANSKTR